LPDDIFTYQNPNFGKFWRAFEWKMFVSITVNRKISQPFGIFMVIRYI
jgi:hypothetical protein